MGKTARFERLRRDFADAKGSFGGMAAPRIPYQERTAPRLLLERMYRSHAVTRARGGLADTIDRVRGSHDAELPPRRLQEAVGAGDYRGVGDSFRNLFVELGGLEPQHDVLEIGSGSGRMAFALRDWLTGSYEGFDVMPEAVEWCQREITSRHPRFKFRVADIRSGRYNPNGTSDAASYRFEYDDDSFDFAFATSVFTHLSRAVVENYVGEIARVLRPGGRCLATYFLLNDETARLMGGHGQFGFEQDGQFVVDQQVPERAAAFMEDDVREIHARHGLPIEAIHHGSWCGREDYASFQDITVAVRR